MFKRLLINIINQTSKTPSIGITHRIISVREDGSSSEDVVWYSQMSPGVTKEHTCIANYPQSAVKTNEKFEACSEISLWVCSILKIASDWMTF